MKTLFFMLMLLCMALVYTSCTKEKVAPVKTATTNSKQVMDSGGQQPPVYP